MVKNNNSKKKNSVGYMKQVRVRLAQSWAGEKLDIGPVYSMYFIITGFVYQGSIHHLSLNIS